MSSLARWITLQDPAFAAPLRGAPSRIAAEFGLSAEDAGVLLEQGVLTGAIALLDADTGASFCPSVQAMATQIDWATGWLTIGGQPLKMLVIHWPDVERFVARPRSDGRAADNSSDAPPSRNTTRKRPGPKGNATEKAAAEMLKDLRLGRRNLAELQGMKQEALAAMYGVASRDTAQKALKMAVSEFNCDSNSDK